MTEEKEWKELLSNLPKDREINIVDEAPDPVRDAIEGLELYEGVKN